MKYKSVWNNHNNNNDNEKKKKNEEQISSSSSSSQSQIFNEWIPFIHPIHHHPVIIGREQDYFYGVRAVIGGTNHQLLFITYFNKNMSVFNLNTCEYVTHVTLRIQNLGYHAFVSVSNSNENENNNKNKNNNNDMVLITKDNDGLYIRFDEWNGTFHFQTFSLPICLQTLHSYSYVCVNHVIYLFGGWDSKKVYAYKVREKKWMECTHTLPYTLYGSVAVLNKDNTCVHIIGGFHGETKKLEEKQIKWSSSLLRKTEWKLVHENEIEIEKERKPRNE